MQVVVNSANINTFFVKVTFDIFNRKVIFDTSGSTYNNLAAVKGISFSLIDQSGLELANGGFNFTTPQIPQPISSANWIWTLDLSSVNFAFLFQTYKISAAIQDANGTIYYTNPVFKTLCQPTDLDASGFVPGVFQIIPDTINSVLTVKELTQLVYNALTPTGAPVKTGILSYPTGTIAPVNFSNTPFSNNVIFTGEYRINCTTVATYNLQDDVYAAVTYLTNNVFKVTVANKIADLLCCISKIQDIAVKRCNDSEGQNAQQQLNYIAPYLLIGIAKETSGQDATNEANFIRKYLACDCGSASVSQSEFTPINPAVNSIVLSGGGGTSVPAPTITGNTKTYNITSSIYQVVKGVPGDPAFTIATDTSVANVVKYVLTINYDAFAGSILTAIGADPALLNQLNNLISSSAFSTAGLDGLCVIDLTTTDYSLAQNITGATIISNITIGGIIHMAPSNLFASNQAAVLAWLNSLSLGSFSVNVAGGIISILSLANANIISTMAFTSPNVVVQFQAANKTLVQVLQALFTYVCEMTDAQVELASALSLCTFDYNGVLINTNFSGTQQGLNAGIAAAICNIANRINTLTSTTCATLKNIFQDAPAATFNLATDRILSFVGGSCNGLTAKQVMLALISQVNSDQQVHDAFCAIDCSVPATCPDISNTNLSALGQTSIGLYSLTWASSASASQTVTVKYRISGSSAPYTIATGALGILPNGNLSGSSPFAITGLTGNTTYDIFVQNNCGGTGIVKQVTTPATSVISGTYLLSNASYSVCGAVPITLYSPLPFATGVTMYQDAGLSMPVTGFAFIASSSSGHVFALNTVNGVVGSDTGLLCSTGVAGSYILGNTLGSVCSNPSVTRYTNGAFNPGGVLYNDSALSSPVTGSVYVVNLATNGIFNLNSTTGVIGASTGTNCTGTATLTLHFVHTAGGSFLNFQATLNRPIDANVNINRMFADGFTVGDCSSGAVASAQKNSTMTITTGNTTIGSNPDAIPPPTGSWASAIADKVYNVIVNGSAVINGSVLSIGSYLVTVVLPLCE